ncbi:MAG: diacylglycerol kinase family protein [Cyanobacteria bacterium P01_H01_bin.119]
MPTSEQASKVLDKTAQPSPNTDRAMAWQVASNLFVSFKYAGEGIVYAFRTQRNFRIHSSIAALVLTLAWVLHLSRVEIAILCLTISAVLTLELINTALESVVDLTVQQTYHELAKIAKDCAAGAVLIAALTSVAVALCLLLPPILELTQLYDLWF